MSKRVNISSGSPWEDIVGYSRAVKVGDQLFVSGTTATNEKGEIVGIENSYQQTKQCINNIESALNKVSYSLSDIVRIRIYVVNINEWEEIGKAISESFQFIKPAATMVEVSKLITPEALVEIEAEAVQIL